MKTVQTIIELFGGLATLRDNPIKLEVKGFMPLSIEFIGTGPRRMPLVSVMHCYEQHGDLCRDPDMEFEIGERGEWHPISYRQDSIGMMQEAVFRDAVTRDVAIRPKLVRELESFAKTWSKSLEDQGFLDAARKEANERGQDSPDEES
jgi:hypothetical protein